MSLLRFFSLFLISFHSISAVTFGYSFLSPVLDHLHTEEMERWYRPDTAKDSPASDLNTGLLEWYLGEYHCLSREIHLCEEWRQKVASRCERWEEGEVFPLEGEAGARAGYLCALLRNEELNKTPWIRQRDSRRKLQRALKVARTGALEEEERWMVEGQLQARMAPFGDPQKSALVKLRFLQAKHPELKSTAFWLGQAHFYRGQSELAEGFWKSGSGVRPQLLGTQSGRLRQEMDGVPSPGFGFSLGLGRSAGVFGRGHWRDDRLSDRNRGAEVGLILGTRPYIQLSGRWREGEWLNPLEAVWEGYYRFAERDFAGLGISSQEGVDSSVSETRWGIQWKAEYAVLDFRLDLGWRLGGYSLKEFEGTLFPLVTLLDKNSTVTSGPVAALAYNTLDSEVLPARGSLVSLEGYFPREALGSKRSFELWKLHLKQFYSFDLWPWTTGLEIQAQHATSQVPFSELPELGVGLGGFPSNRYYDRNTLAARWLLGIPLSRPFFARFFLSTGTTAADSGGLFKNAWKGGVGVQLAWQHTRFRGRLIHLEASFFGSTFQLRVNAGL